MDVDAKTAHAGRAPAIVAFRRAALLRIGVSAPVTLASADMRGRAFLTHPASAASLLLGGGDVKGGLPLSAVPLVMPTAPLSRLRPRLRAPNLGEVVPKGAHGTHAPAVLDNYWPSKGPKASGRLTGVLAPVGTGCRIGPLGPAHTAPHCSQSVSPAWQRCRTAIEAIRLGIAVDRWLARDTAFHRHPGRFGALVGAVGLPFPWGRPRVGVTGFVGRRPFGPALIRVPPAPPLGPPASPLPCGAPHRWALGLRRSGHRLKARVRPGQGASIFCSGLVYRRVLASHRGFA